MRPVLVNILVASALALLIGSDDNARGFALAICYAMVAITV